MINKSLRINVELTHFHEVEIATLIHKGAPFNIGNTITKFIDWRKENKLPPSKNRTFNLVYDDPNLVKPEDYRFGLGTEIKGKIKKNELGIIKTIIPSGRCAVVRHIGSDDFLGDIIHYLYSEWLALNNETLRDFPLFYERISFFPEVNESEMITDIYLPLQPI